MEDQEFLIVEPDQAPGYIQITSPKEWLNAVYYFPVKTFLVLFENRQSF